MGRLLVASAIALLILAIAGAAPRDTVTPGAAPAKAAPADSLHGKAAAGKASTRDTARAKTPPGVAPEDVQPVPFSHKIHAGSNRIGCLMCHAYAEHAPTAGIPSMGRCAGCHKFIDKNKPDVQTVMTAFRAGKPLLWSRIYRLQDFVFFTHERHVAAGLACQTCHGAVETMPVLTQASPLTMGWCVDCHRQKNAPTDCLTCHR